MTIYLQFSTIFSDFLKTYRTGAYMRICAIFDLLEWWSRMHYDQPVLGVKANNIHDCQAVDI